MVNETEQVNSLIDTKNIQVFHVKHNESKIDSMIIHASREYIYTSRSILITPLVLCCFSSAISRTFLHILRNEYSLFD